MPTYDYECDACGHCFEVFQPISDQPKKKCPECGKSRLRRLFGTGAALVFKGSGFYQTDYRSDSYKKAAEAEKSTTSDAKDKSADKNKKSDQKSSDQKSSDQKSSDQKSSGKSDKKKSE